MGVDKDNAGPTIRNFIYPSEQLLIFFFNLSSLSCCCVTLLI
jgi:hypothetical protein